MKRIILLLFAFVLSLSFASTSLQAQTTLEPVVKFSYDEHFLITEELKADIFKVGSQFEIDLDTSLFKNHTVDGVTYYVSEDGDDTNDGLTISEPLKSIDVAIAKADAETVVLLEGNYYADTNFTTELVIDKSINLIGIGDVKIINGYEVTWADEGTYVDVYETTLPTDFYKIVSLDVVDEFGDFLQLTQKTSLSTEVAVTPFTYVAGSSLYVNLSETPTSDNIAVLSDAISVIVTDSTTDEPINVYMENIQIIGGENNVVVTTQAAQTEATQFISVNNEFLHSYGNGFQLFGGNAIIEDTIVAQSRMDGLSYKLNGVHLPNAVEIGVTARNNGHVTDSIINNASSMHDGGYITRINGLYFGSQGGNIVDAYASSYNVNVTSHSSEIDDATRAGNFVLIGGGTPARMWIIESTSSSSDYDIIVDGTSGAAAVYTFNNDLNVGVNNEIDPGTIQELDYQTFYYVFDFETNGGSTIEDVLVPVGDDVTMPANPTKTGYTFDGWYTDEDLTEEFDATAPVTDDVTLYAKWVSSTSTGAVVTPPAETLSFLGLAWYWWALIAVGVVVVANKDTRKKIKKSIGLK